jgi:hypothetical protein
MRDDYKRIRESESYDVNDHAMLHSGHGIGRGMGILRYSLLYENLDTANDTIQLHTLLCTIC